LHQNLFARRHCFGRKATEIGPVEDGRHTPWLCAVGVAVASTAIGTPTPSRSKAMRVLNKP
jgi:hypothetical protein